MHNVSPPQGESKDKYAPKSIPPTVCLSQVVSSSVQKLIAIRALNDDGKQGEELVKVEKSSSEHIRRPAKSLNFIGLYCYSLSYYIL